MSRVESTQAPDGQKQIVQEANPPLTRETLVRNHVINEKVSTRLAQWLRPIESMGFSAHPCRSRAPLSRGSSAPHNCIDGIEAVKSVQTAL